MFDEADLTRRIDGFLAKLVPDAAETDGADPLRLDAEGMVSLRFPDGPELVLQAYDQPALLRLRAEVMRLPADAEAVMRRCLQLNLFGLPGIGLVLAHDADMDGIVLCQEVMGAAITGEDDFVAVLSDFVEALPKLRHLLDEAQGVRAGDEPDPAMFSDAMMVFRG